MRDYRETFVGLRGAAKGLREINMPRTAKQMEDAADAIEELLARDVVPTDFHERCLQLEIRKRIELEKQMPHWISVEERLPEKHKVVLFYIPWNKTNMIGWIDEGGGINLEGYGKCYDFSLIKPSHWMPLPEKPKENKDND